MTKTKKESKTESEEEVYLSYTMRVRKMIINVHDGGTLIMQSGSPKNPPPRPGGGG